LLYVILYLLAIVAANLGLTALLPIYGPWISVATAFVFIGADFTLRDGLTDAWRGRGLVWKMGLLICAGSALSYALNRNAETIAVASAVAWGAAAIVDWACYMALYHRPWMQRTTGSNIPSSAVDSVVFPWLAFGGFNVALTIAQFVAKVGGGLVWAYLLKGRRAATGDEVAARVAEDR
jgi:uncharacterized PurR-regulated membrane protein YhhQ (DUF165 family)